jgi:hypothetical protein
MQPLNISNFHILFLVLFNVPDRDHKVQVPRGFFPHIIWDDISHQFHQIPSFHESKLDRSDNFFFEALFLFQNHFRVYSNIWTQLVLFKLSKISNPIEHFFCTHLFEKVVRSTHYEINSTKHKQIPKAQKQSIGHKQKEPYMKTELTSFKNTK